MHLRAAVIPPLLARPHGRGAGTNTGADAYLSALKPRIEAAFEAEAVRDGFYRQVDEAA